MQIGLDKEHRFSDINSSPFIDDLHFRLAQGDDGKNMNQAHPDHARLSEMNIVTSLLTSNSPSIGKFGSNEVSYLHAEDTLAGHEVQAIILASIPGLSTVVSVSVFG